MKKIKTRSRLFQWISGGLVCSTLSAFFHPYAVQAGKLESYAFCFPDSTEEYADGDTVKVYKDGDNTIIVLFEDTTFDSLATMLSLDFTASQPNILIELNATSDPFPQDLFGVNVSGMFKHTKANEDDLSTIYGTDHNPWDYLVDLAPKTIRWPSGGGGTFMHPLGSPFTSNTGDPDYGDLNGGYSFDMEDMIRYFDQTDGTPNYSGIDMDEILDDIFEAEADGPENLNDQLESWMKDSFVENFKDYLRDCETDGHFDPGTDDPEDMEELFINQFIHLVKAIEDGNPGHTVDVIYCADILGQTAHEVQDVVNYLLDNEIYDVHVAGVELGNETYSKIYQTAVGFYDFDHYWVYINGDDYTGLTGSFNGYSLDYVLPADVASDHDFIYRLKNFSVEAADLKIGLPAIPNPNCGDYEIAYVPEDFADSTFYKALFGGGAGCDYPEWNQQMVDYFDEKYVSGGITRYFFDAIVIHNYYNDVNSPLEEDNTNWHDILVPPGDICIDGDDGTAGLQLYSGAQWDFSDPTDPDGRLDCAYKGLIGYGNLQGNWRHMITDGWDNSWATHADELLFEAADTDPSYKEIWTTEFGLSIKNNNTENEEEIVSIPANSLVHAYLDQEWIMKKIKANHSASYRENFHTVSTIQNYLGDGDTYLMNKSDDQDQVELDIIDLCGDFDDEVNYYLPRTPYYQMLLMHPLFDDTKDLLNTTVTMYSGNLNLPPTTFILNTTVRKIIVYYTNIKPVAQTYYIDPHDVGTIFGADADLNDGDVYIYYIEGDQLYSTSGDSKLWYINHAYDACTTAAYYSNRFEIHDIRSVLNTGTCAGAWGVSDGVCVTVPAYSVGYFEIPVTLYRKGAYADIYRLYPNPASTGFMIYQKEGDKTFGELMDVSIYDMTGVLLAYQQAEEGQTIDITTLPVGVYTVVIHKEGFPDETEKLVKMQ